MSDDAQLSTIAFSALAFITGDPNADTFFPPGKVADFFGFQYMRDVDKAGYGHNTTFLTKAAMTVWSILDEGQRSKVVALAKEQAPKYANFAFNRLPLIEAFRNALEGAGSAATSTLDSERVAEYTGRLYETDAELSIGRAQVVGEIIQSLTPEQRTKLDALSFNDSATWPDIPEDESLKRSLSNTEYQTVMTFASETLSWYLGNLAADVYFCPERHGTYFGGFFMKDYPAMGNPDYFISTSVTGDKGKAFLEILEPNQRTLITSIIDEQRSTLDEIAVLRLQISELLRVAQTGEAVDTARLTSLITHYGELDGAVSGLYAQRFAQVNGTLTNEQRNALVALRDLPIVAPSAYRFATEVPNPLLPNIDYLFGVGQMPSDAGKLVAPEDFATADLQHKPKQSEAKK